MVTKAMVQFVEKNRQQKNRSKKIEWTIPMHRTHDDGNGKIYLQEWRFIPPSNIAALSLPHDATWRNAAPRPPVKGAAVFVHPYPALYLDVPGS